MCTRECMYGIPAVIGWVLHARNLFHKPSFKSVVWLDSNICVWGAEIFGGSDNKPDLKDSPQYAAGISRYPLTNQPI